MKMLYDLARRMNPQQFPKNEPGSAVLSVHYGAESTFAYNRYPLWFKRVGEVEGERLDERPTKRSQGDGDGEEDIKGDGKKKKRVRQGKQTDIGSLLLGFG